MLKDSVSIPDHLKGWPSNGCWRPGPPASKFQQKHENGFKSGPPTDSGSAGQPPTSKPSNALGEWGQQPVAGNF